MPEFMKLADLKAAGIEFSSVHLKRLEEEGSFPKRIQLSPNKPRWLKSEIEKFVADKIGGR
jgi:predicted DNA-binding transcriptional regulator AlpA